MERFFGCKMRWRSEDEMRPYDKDVRMPDSQLISSQTESFLSPQIGVLFLLQASDECQFWGESPDIHSVSCQNEEIILGGGRYFCLLVFLAVCDRSAVFSIIIYLVAQAPVAEMHTVKHPAP